MKFMFCEAYFHSLVKDRLKIPYQVAQMVANIVKNPSCCFWNVTDSRDAYFCRSFCPKIVIRSLHAYLLSLSGVDDVSGEQWWLLLFMMKLFVSDINKVISYNCSHFFVCFFWFG